MQPLVYSWRSAADRTGFREGFSGAVAALPTHLSTRGAAYGGKPLARRSGNTGKTASSKSGPLPPLVRWRLAADRVSIRREK